MYFAAHGLYYDRRKNYYKNLNKAADKIVSIPYLAQALMAVALFEPNQARARPSSLLKSENDYRRVFDPKRPHDVYFWIAKTQKAIDAYLRRDDVGASAEERLNLRFHLAMLVVANALGHRLENPSVLNGLTSTTFKDNDFGVGLQQLRTSLPKFYNQAKDASMDRTAKSRDFVEFLLDEYHPK